MATSRRLRWLHRIGYVTTALIAAELLFVAGVAGVTTYRLHQRDEARRQETAYHDGPFRDDQFTERPFAELPPMRTLGHDGLRFTAQPTIMHQTFAVALASRPGQPTATGVLLVRDDNHATHQGPFRLDLPIATYRALMGDLDRKLDGFGGDPRWGLDGTEVTIERVRGDRVTSGHGNAIPTYDGVSEEVLRTISRTNPALPLPPPGRNWYPPGD